MKVYKPNIVQEIEAFYGALLYSYVQYPNVVDHLTQLALRMWEGVQVGYAAIFSEINNYNKNYLGVPIDQLMSKELSIQDCYDTVAHQYGFDSWAQLNSNKQLYYDIEFEQAVNYLLGGQKAELQDQLDRFPYLISATSKYGHQATLLHYTASNGVEFWRQKVPYNLVELTRLLLEKGADKNALLNVYGGDCSLIDLLETSAHPYEVGITQEMKQLLTTWK